MSQLHRFFVLSRRLMFSGALIPAALVLGGVILNVAFTVTPAATKAVLGGPTEELAPRPELAFASVTSRLEAEETLNIDDELSVTYSAGPDTLIAFGITSTGGAVSSASTASAARSTISNTKRLELPPKYQIPLAGPISELHGKNHPGVDITAKHGTPVKAANDGFVTESTIGLWNGGYGGKIMVKHADGVYTVYAHLSKSAVTVGDAVAQGQVIGYVGSTGISTGPHLHFEIRKP